MTLKPFSTEVVEPKPKYGHLSKPDPAWAPLIEETNNGFAALWNLPMDQFKQGWLSAPVVLPDGCPVLDKDFKNTHAQVPVRDGTKIEVRFYTPIEPVEDALLVVKAHGGGTFFNHFSRR